MRTYLLALYAPLLLALTGGNCEFRASSQQPVHSNPPEGEPTEPNSGLLIDIRVGESRALTAQKGPRRGQVAPLEVCLTESLLAEVRKTLLESLIRLGGFFAVKRYDIGHLR